MATDGVKRSPWARRATALKVATGSAKSWITRWFMPGAASILTLMLSTSVNEPAEADVLTWAKRGVIIGGGVETALLLEQAAILVAAAVTAQCVTANCLSEIQAFLTRHPLIGRPIINHEFKVYAKKHPEQAAVTAQVQAAVADQAAVAKSYDGNGRPISRSVPQRSPGDCNEDDQQSLQASVNRLCKGQQTACRAGDPADVLASKLDRNRQCVGARNRVMQICFQGGDLGHRIQLDVAIASVTNCEKIIAGSQ